MENKLFNLLERVKKYVPGNIFTGIGVVVYDSLINLPHFELSVNSNISEKSNLFGTLGSGVYPLLALNTLKIIAVDKSK